LDQKVHLTQNQLRELKQDLLAYHRLVKDADMSHTGLMQRLAAATEDETSGVSSSIKSLQGSIYQYQAQIDETKHQLDEMKGQSEIEETEQTTELDRFRAVVNWEAEKAQLTSKLAEAKASLLTAASEFETANTALGADEDRYQKLYLLAPKRKPPTDPDNIETDVDSLFAALARVAAKGGRRTQMQGTELDALGVRNGDLAAIVARRRDEFQHSVSKFALDETRLKEMIRDVRVQSATREQALLSRIEKLRMKLAPVR
jgi:hypothetical protein